MRWILVLGTALFSGLLSSPAVSQEVLTTVTPSRMLAEMQSEGVAAAFDEVDGDTRIKAYWQDHRYEVIFYYCDPNDSAALAHPDSDCEDFQFLATFEGFEGSVYDINTFNVGERFGKALLYDDGSVGVFYVGTLRGGVTSGVFAGHLSWWDTVLENFVEFLGDH